MSKEMVVDFGATSSAEGEQSEARKLTIMDKPPRARATGPAMEATGHGGEDRGKLEKKHVKFDDDKDFNFDLDMGKKPLAGGHAHHGHGHGGSKPKIVTTNTLWWRGWRCPVPGPRCRWPRRRPCRCQG